MQSVLKLIGFWARPSRLAIADPRFIRRLHRLHR
jgi:hypothetical protein